MTADEYVLKIVRRHALPMQLDQATVLYVVNPLKKHHSELGRRLPV